MILCVHCHHEIRSLPFLRAGWPQATRWIHANGLMFCGPSPSRIATPA